MSISRQIEKSIEGSSWVRQMFEKGIELKKQFGEDQVCDLTLGNPVFEPPVQVTDVLGDLIRQETPGVHRYMPNPGFPDTRSFIADQLKKETSLNFTAADITMSVGAGGGLNVVLRTICNPGDEIIVFNPYFVEYGAYASNHGAQLKVVETKEDFHLDFEALRAAFTAETRAVIVNSPNNPTGVVYSREELQQLAGVLEEMSDKFGRTITLISDEPYKRIVYDQVEVPSVFGIYPESMVVYSYSKDLALPGERIGYIAVSPETADRGLVLQGIAIATRILGFVNAPALMQRVLPLVGDAMVELDTYEKNRSLLYDHLIHIGFECVKPEGAFYLFPKSPVENDVEFVQEAQKLNLLLTPGTGFGKSGYFRIAYCFETEVIKRSLPLFSKLAEQYELKKG
jgi:aspartate aminotransferase